MHRNLKATATAAFCVFAVACAGTAPTAPSASTLLPGKTGGVVESRASSGSAAPLAVNGLSTASAPSYGLTDLTLANAGWTCIQPGNGLVLCAPPGTGIPPIPPAADGEAHYNITAFTLDHQFFHRVKLLRPDLYHGQPCQGGDPWVYIGFLDYYECIIPE